MSLPGFYGENTGRAYPLVPFSNVLLGVAVPPATQISDWNAIGLSVTPGQWVQVTDAGRGGGYWKSASPSTGGPGSVTWQFPVVPGRQYRVAATWPGDPSQASNARFTITETEGQGYFELATAYVDQRVAPTQYLIHDAGWLELGIVNPVRHILLVTVHDDADAPPVADAIWVEDITPTGTEDAAKFQPPLDTLVDFGCLVGLDAEFNSAVHTVYLNRIRQIDDTFKFYFRSDAPGLLEHALVFSRNLSDPEYTTDYAEAVRVDDDGEPVDDPEEPQEALWEGFLVTGPMDSLAAMMPPEQVLEADTGPQVEPALVQNLGRSYVRTINLANQDRTHVVPPAGCPGDDDPGTDYAYIVNVRGLVGDLRFKEGYNIAIRQNVRNNSLAFAASQGAGAGVPCEEIPLYPDEQPPDGSTLLTGGPACDEVINSINGLTASVIRLVPAMGTRIVPSQTNSNTLIVDFDRHDMTVCGPVEVVVEELVDG